MGMAAALAQRFEDETQFEMRLAPMSRPLRATSQVAIFGGVLSSANWAALWKTAARFS